MGKFGAFFRVLALGLACALAAACGTMQSAYRPAMLSADHLADPQRATVLLSTGAPEECVSFSTFLYMMPAGSSYGRNVVALLPVDGYTIKSDFEAHQGTVHALSVAPGRYYFSPWLANPYFTATASPRFDIAVEAGEIVYVGEYYLPGRCSAGSYADINDKWERDRAIIAAQNPNIDLSRATTRLMVLTGNAIGN